MLILILTPILVEYLQVRKRLDSPQVIIRDGVSYEHAKFKGRFLSYDIILRQTGSKNNDVALETDKAIRFFQPSIVVLTGIAGGVKDVSIGDIVIADKLYGFDGGKETEEGFKARPEVFRTSPDLLDFTKNFIIQKFWSEESNVFIGPIASSNSVIASTNSESYKKIKNHYNDTLAIEMEAQGFGKAMHSHSHVKHINIRGISDLLDNKLQSDNEGNQELAARNAAAFTFEILKQLDSKYLKIPIMTTRELATKIYEILLPAGKLESIKDIGKELKEATNNSISELWKKVSPIFIEEYEELKETPDDKDIQGAIRNKLKRELEKSEDLKKEVNEMLLKIEKESSKSGDVFKVSKSENVVQTKGNISVGGDFIFGEKKKQNNRNEDTPENKKIEEHDSEEQEKVKFQIGNEKKKINLEQAHSNESKQESEESIENSLKGFTNESIPSDKNQSQSFEEIKGNLLPEILNIKKELSLLNSDFQSKLKYDLHKEKVIDNLHNELQIHKDGLGMKLLKPVIMDIISIIDDTNKMLRNYDDPTTMEKDFEKLLKWVRTIPYDLEDLLYKYGVEVLESTEEKYDPSIQKVLKVELTDDEKLDKNILKKIKNGYRWENKLIRHEMVSVLKFQETK